MKPQEWKTTLIPHFLSLLCFSLHLPLSSEPTSIHPWDHNQASSPGFKHGCLVFIQLSFSFLFPMSAFYWYPLVLTSSLLQLPSITVPPSLLRPYDRPAACEPCCVQHGLLSWGKVSGWHLSSLYTQTCCSHRPDLTTSHVLNTKTHIVGVQVDALEHCGGMDLNSSTALRCSSDYRQQSLLLHINVTTTINNMVTFFYFTAET